MKGTKRHLLVDTEGFGLRVKVHSAKVMDYEGIKALLDRAKGLCSRASLTYGWRRATAGRTRAETGGKDTRVGGGDPQRSAQARSRGSADSVGQGVGQREGVAVVVWQKLMPEQGFVILPQRWVVERTFSWISQNRRMSKDYERLAATSEGFSYVAMTRLTVRRLARAQWFLDSFGKGILRSSASIMFSPGSLRQELRLPPTTSSGSSLWRCPAAARPNVLRGPARRGWGSSSSPR